MQTKQLPPLPSSDDIEVFDGDKHLTDIGLLGNNLCAVHDFDVNFSLREANCRNCGRGFNFEVSKVTYKDGKLCDLNGLPLK